MIEHSDSFCCSNIGLVAIRLLARDGIPHGNSMDNVKKILNIVGDGMTAKLSNLVSKACLMPIWP